LAASGYAFTGIPFGQGTDAGTISYIEKDNLMVVELKKEDDQSCSQLHGMNEFKIGYFNDPAPLTDFQINTKQPFQYCNWDHIMVADGFGKMLGSSYQEISGSQFREVGKNKCVAVFEPMYELREFNTVKMQSKLDNAQAYCATLTHGKLGYGKVEVPEGMVHFFRSNDENSFAVKAIPADHIQEHLDMDYHDGIFWVKFFENNSCTKEIDEQKISQNLLNKTPQGMEYPVNLNALWLNAPEKAKALTFGYNMQEGNSTNFSQFANSKCIRFAKKVNGDVDFKRANKKLRLDPNRPFSSKYVGVTIEQDNPFVPTKYTIKYNHKGHNKADPQNLPGGYHVHENPLDPIVPTDCGSTGGHWNPYNKNTNDDPGWAHATSENGTHFDFEIGDLSRRHGVLGDQDGLIGEFNDWNLPLFGENSVVGKSIVFHRHGHSMRLDCHNLVENKNYNRKERFQFF